MPRLARLFMVSSLAFLACVPSAKELLNLPRPLTTEEMQIVVNGIQQALAGKALRLLQERGTDDREVLIGTRGEPRMIRTTHTGIGIEGGEIIAGIVGDGITIARPTRQFVGLVEYTGSAAVRCEGNAPAAGQLVVEYLLDVTAQTWTVRARESHPGDRALVRPLEMLRAASLESGETRLMRTRIAERSFLGERRTRPLTSRGIRRPIPRNSCPCGLSGLTRIPCCLCDGS